MDKLVVVGNGFDIFHGLPSSYTNFKQFFLQFKEKPKMYYGKYIMTESLNKEDLKKLSFLESLEKYIQADSLWTNFERALGELEEENLKDFASEYLVSYSSEEFKDRDNHGYQTVIEDELSFHKLIPDYLNSWICELNNQKVSKKLKGIMNSSHIFLSFNYTNTLERVYGINENNILHIHGKAPNEKLICGHRDLRLLKQYNQTEDDDIRIVEGEQIIRDYFATTYKDTNKIIDYYRDFWNSLSNVNEIHILGHSLSNIDIPYFKKFNLIVNTNCPQWYFTYYLEEEREHHIKQLINFGVPKSKISTKKMEDYCEI